MSDNELGAFLRARREAVSPADVGLPTGSRRRTPGLRRAELATLAGVSVDYLTRLEQGRDRRPSASVLGALAHALRLSNGDRAHLGYLAKVADGGFSCASAVEPPASTVRATVRALLDRLEPAPAVVLNRVSDLVAYNGGFERLAAPLGMLDGDRPNLIRFVFADSRARTVYSEWDQVADEILADLKAGCGVDDPYIARLADDLTAGAAEVFADRLAAVTATSARAGVQHLDHPVVGELRLNVETLTLPDSEDQRLVVYLPADEAAAGGLDRLTGRRPGALRAVPGNA